MKSFLPLLLTIFGYCTLTAQVQDTTYQVVSVISPAVFYLESRIVSQVSGYSRLTVPFKLPPNTVRWYYTFAATSNKGDVPEWVGLAAQLTKYVDKSGIASLVMGHIAKPAGTAICDIHLLDTAAVKAFEAKTDDKWTSNPVGSKVSLTSATVEVPMSGKSAMAIGLLNPSLQSPCNVKIEITALVRTVSTRYNLQRKAGDNQGDATALWSAKTKDSLTQAFQALFFGKTGAAVDAVSNAMLRKIAHDFTPDEYANLGKTERELMLQQLRKDCFVTTQNTQLADDEQRYQTLLAHAQLSDAATTMRDYREIITLGYPSETVYNALTKALICQQQYDEASKTLELSQKRSPTLADPMTAALLQAHIFLLTNNYSKAENIYTRYRGKKISDTQTWEQAVDEDFKWFVKNKIFSSQYDNIRKKLKI